MAGRESEESVARPVTRHAWCSMTFLHSDPTYDKVRSDPRFVAMLRKLNMPTERKLAPLQ